MNDQKIKYDAGKPRLSLAPISELEIAITRVREYGIKKYKDPNNWKKVSVDRYFDAMLRHLNQCRKKGMQALDDESGLPHLWHVACNLAFIFELLGGAYEAEGGGDAPADQRSEHQHPAEERSNC